MKKRTMLRLGSGVSLPMAILLLVFFFLPWTEVHCGSMKVGKASGWQLTRGEITPVKLDLPLGAKPQEGEPSGSDAPADKADKTDKSKEQDLGESIEARPWFILGLILPIVLLVLAALGVIDWPAPGGSGTALISLGILGMVVMLLAVGVDYEQEILADMKAKQEASQASQQQGGPMAGMADAMGQKMQEQMAGQIQTKKTGIVWASLGLYFLIVGCGVLNLKAMTMR